MTYIVKHLNNGTCGVYDTIRACFPIAGSELRAAGIARLEGTALNGWFKKSETEQAEAIAADLNDYYNLGEFVPSKVSRPKAKPVEDDSSMADMAAALLADA